MPTAPRDDAAADEAPASGKSASVARPAAWVLSVAAAGALGLGVYETLVWANEKHEFDDHRKVTAGQPGPHDCGTSLLGRGGTECQTLFDAAGRARTMFIVGYAVGGALAAGAAVLFVVSSPTDPESHAFACAPAGNLMGASCRISF